MNFSWCDNCKALSNQHMFSGPRHLVDGHKLRPIQLCHKCATSDPQRSWFYCFDCEDIYHAKSKWTSEADVSSFSAVPCPKHSHNAYEPRVNCIACGHDLPVRKCHATKRGHYICFQHSGDKLAKCAASYCRTLLHPDIPGVEQSGTNLYCEDCADAKTIPGAANSSRYHPLTWDYRKGCPCDVCQYLAGRSDLWPKGSDPSIDPNHVCVECGCDVSKFDALNNSHGTFCHICAFNHIPECESCHAPHYMDHYQPFYPPPRCLLNLVCSTCLADVGMWYCETSCEAWFPEYMECGCGGILPYNYTPSQFTFFTASSQGVVTKTPFFGLEIEVEAQKKNSNRKQGARIAKEIIGDCSYVVHDGTLLGNSNKYGPNTGGQKGFEIVTHPFTYEWFEENWPRFDKLLTTLSSEGFRSWEGGRCGVHIHVSRKPMSQAHQMRFLHFIYGSSNLALCVGQRDYSSDNLQKFAPFDLEDRSKFILKITKNQNPRTSGHYAAVNANKKDTLEARWFRGTLNPDSFRKNVEFMHSTWYFTKEFGHKSANEYNYVDWLISPPESRRYSTLVSHLESNYITRR